MMRKKGKLPGETMTIEYKTEYSTDCLEIQKEAIKKDDHFLLVDDCIATGGTLEAAVNVLNGIGHVEAAFCLFKVDCYWEKAK